MTYDWAKLNAHPLLLVSSDAPAVTWVRHHPSGPCLVAGRVDGVVPGQPPWDPCLCSLWVDRVYAEREAMLCLHSITVVCSTVDTGRWIVGVIAWNRGWRLYLQAVEVMYISKDRQN